MKKIILLIVFTIGGWQHALAQVATNGGSGLAVTYTSLSGAITALNAATITSPVVITLTGNETAPAGGYNITATGTSTNTITIAGSSSTITAPSQTAGSLTDAIFKIVGGDYITIQGFTMQERSLTPVAADVTAATNTMTEFGVALFYASTTNGAQYCTVQNNTITLNRTYQNTFGIYSNSTHSATDITTSATGATGGSNSGLKVYGNTINNINHGVLIIGATAAANFNTGIDIGGTASGTGNTISNFGTTGTFSGFLNVDITVNGIVVRNSTGFNVSYNSITSSNGGVSTAGTALRGVYIPAASIAPTGTFTNTINNNTIALTHGFTSGIIQGIRVDVTTGTATSTQNVNNNNFTALRSSVVTSGTITAISNSMPNLANNCNGNTFTNISTNTTGSFTFFAHVYNMPATGSQTLDGNSIVTGFSKTGAGGTVTISTSGSSSPNGTFHTFTNNNFSNIMVTGATGITGVSNGDGSSSSATRTVTGNTFNNWTGGTSAIMGLSYAYIGGTTSSVSNNTLTNITGQSTITSINIGSFASLATTLNVANNTISNLTSTGTGGAVIGLACTNASTTININGNAINTLSSTGASEVTALGIGGGATTNIFQNKIYNVSGSNASSTVNGILISAGLNINTYNNLIGDLTAPAASGTDVIRGISITSTRALSTHKIYSNTIYLNAASTGADFGGSGIYHTASGTATTAALDLQNNIIINGLTPKGTGLAVAFRRSAGAANNLANYAATSDKNLFYAGTPGASNLIYSDGTSSAQTMADYKAGVFTAGTIAPRDANSFTEAWTSSNFVSVTGSSANYLQPATTFITQAESGGNTIALTSPDYNNVVRPGLGGTSYDIGAWEFSGQGQTQGLTVTYDSQSGTAIANGSTTTGGSIAASPGTPTRAGYTFNGWFVASTGGSAINFPYTHGRTASFTLYAQWTANTLTVTYDSQSGTAIANGSTTTGGSIATSPGTPTRTGYTFNGWFVASTGGSAISFPYTHGRTASFTLYAQWTANNLTVTYDSQSGTAIANGSTTTGGSIATSPGTPARTGYTFNGWFVAATGGGAISFPYTHGRTASFTLYAQWTANNLTVTYDSQSGTAIANGSTTTGGSIATSPGTPARTGYTFNGWFVASSGGSAISFPYTHGRTASFTLYAQWTANTLTVTFDSQSGTAIANGSTTTGGSIAASPGTPTRAGFTFNGWFEASSEGSAISFPYTHGQTANFTLYAQWTVITYTITATAGAGGTISPGTGVVNAGSNNTYTITPDSGYLISDVMVDSTSAAALTTGSYAAGGTYVFTDVQANHTISITFSLACTNVGLVSATATASSICANATTTLTYSGLTGTNAAVTWTQNADGTGTTYGTGTPSSAVGPGTYYAYATGDCGSAISIAVTVATTPANAGADASTCGSPYSAYNLLYQNATASEGTVSWSSSGDGEFQYLTGSGPYTDLSPLYRIGPTDIINGSAIITLTVTAADNCVTTDSFTLTLVPPPTAIIDPIIVNPWDELLCTGGSYSFSNAVIAEGANIYWSRSGDGSFNNDSIQNPIYTPGPQDIANGYVNIDLNVHSYGENSCNNRVSVRLVIDPILANAGADASTCGNPDSAYNLLYQNATASEGTVSWSSSGDGEFQYLTGSGPYTDLSPLYRIGPTDIINGSAIITLTVTAADNSVTTDSFTLTLVPPPSAIIDPIIVNPWDELHVCAGGSYSFSNAVIAEGANIYWYRSGDGSFNNDSIQNPIYTPGPQDIADGYVYIDLNVTSYGETSCNNRVSVRLVIDQIPAITASAGTNGSISSTGVTSMSCDGTEDKTYAITPDAGYSISDVTVDGNSATALTTGSYALGGNYVFTDVQVNHTISVTFALACSNVGLASATATASPICANATTTLTYSGLTGTNASVTWTQNADGTGTTYGTGTPSSAVGPGTYYAYATGDCGSAVSIPVTVGSKVTVGLASATATASPICANATTTLTYSGLTGTNASVTWTQNADGTGTTYGTGTPSSAVGPGTYYAYATGDCGTAVSIAVTVATTPKTNPTFTQVSAICSGATMVALLTTSVNEIEGTWSPELNNLETTEYTFTPIQGQCANTATMTITVTPATTNGSVTTSICAGDSYTWPLPNGTGLTYASAQTGLTNVVGCNTATLNLTITAQLQWYLDADSDGYYTGAAVTSCTSPGAGYTTTVMGGGDCNDVNSAIHPGVQPTEPTKVNCWDNFVFNTGTCSWDNTGTQATEPTKVNSWDTFVFNIGTCSWDNTGTPTNSTTILDSQCGSTLATLNSTITAYPVANATLYTFKIVTSGTNAIRYYRSTTSSFNLTQVTGSLYNTTYTLSVAATIGGSLKAYGSACTVTTPAVPLSKVQDSQCGVTLAALSTVIVPVAFPLVQGYKYKVTNTATNEVNYYTRSATATFALSHRPDTNSGSVAIKLSSTYSVAVAVKHNGVFSDYGDACLVSTPLLPTTKIQDALCGTTLANLNSYLYLKAGVAGQKGYRFKVTQGAEERTYDSPSGSYPFQLKQFVGGAAYATTYEVAVSVFYNGAWQPYGETCTVTTPAAAQSKLATTQCGITLNKTNTNVLTANSVAVAQAYRFEVSKGAATYTIEKTSGSLRTFKLTEVLGLTLQSGATYGIRVAIKANGVWQPYGTSCNVTTYGSPAVVKMADPTAKPESVFNALAYPNPFSNAFQLELHTSSKAAVNLKVYDVLGRLIENRQWNVEQASEQEIGNNYPSGVYNIILNQGENVKTLRVIKR